MIGIITKDMTKAVKFYRELGFKILKEFGEDYIELDNEGVRISINTKEMVSNIYGYTPETVGDRIELAFLCNNPEEVNSITKKFTVSLLTLIIVLCLHLGQKRGKFLSSRSSLVIVQVLLLRV